MELSQTVETKLEVSLQNIVQGTDAAWIIYDALGTLWAFSYARPASGFSLFARLLAGRIFRLCSFMREVPIAWRERRLYAVSELRDAYLQCIDQDDGWLTRFVEREELERRIRSSNTFHELLLTWRWTRTEDPDPGDETSTTGW
jgi:hypothetical protein